MNKCFQKSCQVLKVPVNKYNKYAIGTNNRKQFLKGFMKFDMTNPDCTEVGFWEDIRHSEGGEGPGGLYGGGGGGTQINDLGDWLERVIFTM